MNPAWFDFLLSASLRAAIIVSVLVVLRWPLRKLVGSHWVSLLWCVVLLRLLVPVPIESRWSAFNFWPQVPQAEQAVAQWQTRVTVVDASTPSAAAPAVARVDAKKRTLRDILPSLWLVGAGFCFVHLAWRVMGAMRLARQARPAQHPRLLEALAGIAPAFRRGAEVKEIDDLGVPALAGLWRPQIWIPRDWIERFETEELRHILLHELGHAHRGDLVIQWLFAVAQCIHWFNPFVWLAGRLSQTDRELACDAWVLERSDDDGAEQYGATLVKAAQLIVNPWRGMPSAVAMASGKRTLFARVRGIGDYQPATRIRAVIGIVLMALVATGLVTDRMHAQAPAPEKAAGAPSAPVSGETQDPPPAVKKVSDQPRQVEVEARFFEVTEKVRREIGLAENQNDPSSLLVLMSTAEVVNGKKLTKQEIEELLFGTPITTKPGVNLISAPRVTTKTGQRAVIEIIREFRYASEYDKDTSAPGGVVPKKFETRNLGVTLEVEPEVGENRAIELILIPQLVELSGFTRVTGLPLTSDAKNTSEPVIPVNKELEPALPPDMPKDTPVQPIFSTRKVTTNVSLQSGSTVLLGGLKRALKPGETKAPDDAQWLFITVMARYVEPSTKTDGAPLTHEFTIDLQWDEKAGKALCSLNGKPPVAPEELLAVLKETIKADMAAGVTAFKARVRADKKVKAQTVKLVLEAVGTVGITDVNIATPAPAPAKPPGGAKGEKLVAVPVDGKPGYVHSPYAAGMGYVDVRGFPPGTEVRCPYSGKLFLVP